MGIAMSNALALVRVHDVGVMLAVVVMWVISRRGRRWF
jgi:hypothetical protein